jgi:4'-phosphopantetheinyl transferase EntD
MTGAPVRSSWIEGLLGAGVVAAELRGSGDPTRLLDEERAGQERWVPKRISEYAAGRQCAHLALGGLGYPRLPLMAQPDRKPRWPVGCVGSITHCKGFAGAAVARADALRSIGIDAEPVGAVDASLWPRILGVEERDWLALRPGNEKALWATVLFSAKEAFYKCQNPVTGRWLEFHAARITVSGERDGAHQFDLAVESEGLRLSGQGGVRDGFVCTGFAWRNPAGP